MTTDGTKGVGKEELLFTSVGKVNLYCTMEINMKFSKKKTLKIEVPYDVTVPPIDIYSWGFMSAYHRGESICKPCLFLQYSS